MKFDTIKTTTKKMNFKEIDYGDIVELCSRDKWNDKKSKWEVVGQPWIVIKKGTTMIHSHRYIKVKSIFAPGYDRSDTYKIYEHEVPDAIEVLRFETK